MTLSAVISNSENDKATTHLSCLAPLLFMILVSRLHSLIKMFYFHLETETTTTKSLQFSELLRCFQMLFLLNQSLGERSVNYSN